MEKVCPKCRGLMRKTPTQIPDKIWIGPFSFDLSSRIPDWLRRATPYICKKCGYIELYVE